MLTATSRAAARSVAPSTRALAYCNPSASLTPQIALALRPAARSFTNSPRALEAAAGSKKKATTAAKKPKAKAVAKKPAVKKPATKKPAAKKKVAPKKKKALKPKPKKVVKKKRVITPEQKVALQMREWKRTSLLSEEPKLLPISPFNIYIAEVAKGCEPGSIGKFSTGYKDLPSAEVNRLQAQAEQNKEKNVQALKAFVEQHTPEDIYIANAARRNLDRKVFKKRVSQLPDARWPKRPAVPHVIFMSEKLKGHSGSASEAMAELSREWKTLGEAGQRPYRERFEREAESYKKLAEELHRKVVERKREIHRETFKGVVLAKQSAGED